MIGFLDRLAGIARGAPAPGAPRVALPPRFSPSTTTLTRDETLPEDMATIVAPPPPSQTPHYFTTPEPLALPHDDSDGPKSADAVFSGVAIEPAALLERPISNIAASSAAAPNGASHSHARVEPPRATTLSVPRFVGFSDTAAQQHAATLPSAPASVRAEPPRAAMLSRLSGRDTPAPLSAATVASRLSPPRDEHPVIHVTIDRIDVRAPAPAKPEQTARRARPQPAMSLADYLRRGPGGRA